jgi:hypothetical protein
MSFCAQASRKLQDLKVTGVGKLGCLLKAKGGSAFFGDIGAAYRIPMEPIKSDLLHIDR